MQRQRRLPGHRWLHAGAWTLATGAATTLSWFGVHTVLNDTSEDPPRALPVSGGPADEATPRASSTHRPRPTPSSPSPTPSDTPTRKPTPTRHHHPGTDGHASGTVESASVRGGRAVFDLGGDTGTLVSATPDPGWQMKVWHAPGYVRVTFTDGSVSSSVFCRWDNAAPRIETYDG
ncbi:hypothetical protein ACQEU8_30965 [Streptomyces sp. CA-250714]|uniref:hypothetical protein n=1 Tax=Streptomyces sp. CA-250714 TaxID=3240060 RepID=UPI003D8A94ED